MGPQSVTPPETERLTTTDDRPRRKRRWGRRLLITLGVLLVVLVGLVALAPTIAGPLIAGAVSGPREDGSVLRIEGLSLSWTGDQSVGSLVYTDAAGETIADLTATLDRSLLALLRDSDDLGTVTLGGEVLVKPAAPDAAEPEPEGGTSVTIERDLTNLRAALEVTQLQVTFADPAGEPVVAVVRGSAAVGPGSRQGGEFSADIRHAGSTGTAQLTVSDVALAAGPDAPLPVSALTAALTGRGLPSAMLDQVARQGGRLQAILGEAADMDATVTLAGSAGDADVLVQSPRSSLDASLRLVDGVLTGRGPVTARLDSAALAALPEVAEAVAGAGLMVVDAPSLTLEVTELRLPLPEGPFDPATYNARAVSLLARLDFGGATVRVPAERLGQTGPPREIATSPATIQLHAVDPGGEVRLTGAVETTIDGAGAGSIQVDLRASDLLTPAGTLRLDALPRLAGTLAARGVPTALAQPFVADAGVDLPRDVGPSLDLTLSARADSAEAPTSVSITAVAERLSASGAVRIDGTSVVSEGPITLRLADAAGVLAARLADSGFAVATTGPVEVSLDRVSVNTEALAASPPDFSGATARVRVQAGPVEASLARAEGEPVAIGLPRTALNADLEGGTLAITGRAGQVRVNNQRAAGRTDVDLRVASLGASQRVTGTVSIAEVDAAALGPLLPSEGVAGALVNLGPTYAVTIRPEVTVGGQTKAGIDVVAANLDLSGSAALTEAGLAADARVHRAGTTFVDALSGRPGLGEAALGPTASGVLALTAGRGPDGAIGAPMDATLELTSPKASTAAPVRVSVTDSGAEVVGGARLEWTLEPAAMAALINAQGEPPVTLAEATPVRLEIKRAFVPLGEGADRPMAAEVDLTTGAFALRGRDGQAQQFDALTATLRTTDTPGHLRAEARLRGAGEEGDTLTADVAIEGLTAGAEPAATGSVRARRVPAGLIDALAGTGGSAADMLGDHANARLDLAGFPRESGTATLTVTAPNAQLEYAGVVRAGLVTNSAPATVTLKRIDQQFGFTLTKFVPIIGGLTKTPSDQPATLEIPTLGLPLDGDLRKISLAMTADPGTGTIEFERGIVALIDPRLVREGRTLGDSFQPFEVTMGEGVLRISNFTLPIGEFAVPAQATFDLLARTEDVVVQLPAGALLADALGGDLAPLRGVLGTALNPPLRKQGPMDADNPWKLDPSWKAPGQPDPGRQIIDGIGGLLRDRLERDRRDEERDGDSP